MKNSNWRIALFIISSTTITTILISVYYPDYKLGIIASLIANALISMIEFRSTLSLEKDIGKTHIATAVERILILLKMHNSYFSNEKMLFTFDTLLKLREVAELRPHDVERFDDIIIDSIDKIKKEIGQPFRKLTGDDELYRSIKLKQAIQYANNYVYALTYDANNYLNRFWAGNFGREYVETNLQVAGRGVIIERVFIVDENVFTGQNMTDEEKEKREKLVDMSNNLRKGMPNCRVYWASKQRIPDKLKFTDTSLLVCDDHVGSESNGTSNGKYVDGYVSYGDRETVELLKERFLRLRRYTDDM